MVRLNDILVKKMQDSEFKEAFEEFEQGFRIGQRLTTLRKKKGLTQKELAEKAHTSQSAIARLESGHHQNLTLSFLQKVSYALDLAPEIRFHEIS